MRHDTQGRSKDCEDQNYLVFAITSIAFGGCCLAYVVASFFGVSQ